MTGVQGDIANLADLDRLYATVEARKGRVDVLFANAGGGEFLPLGAITEAHYDKYFGINGKGTLFTVQKALALMPDGGSIVINGSMVSVRGLPAFSVYAATKAALRSFARSWSVDLKGRHIRVNVVSPGTIVTPGYKNELGLGDEQIGRMVEQAAAGTHWAAPGPRTRSPRPSCSSRRTPAATSRASSFSWTVARPRSKQSPRKRSWPFAARPGSDGPDLD